MPMARRYQAFETRQLLQKAEHQPSPITGAGAHSRTLHAGGDAWRPGGDAHEYDAADPQDRGRVRKGFRTPGGDVEDIVV